jgi:hypothetical protein
MVVKLRCRGWCVNIQLLVQYNGCVFYQHDNECTDLFQTYLWLENWCPSSSSALVSPCPPSASASESLSSFLFSSSHSRSSHRKRIMCDWGEHFVTPSCGQESDLNFGRKLKSSGWSRASVLSEGLARWVSVAVEMTSVFVFHKLQISRNGNPSTAHQT